MKKKKVFYKDKLGQGVEKKEQRVVWSFLKVACNFYQVLKCMYMKFRVNRSKILDMYVKHIYTHTLTFFIHRVLILELKNVI